MANVISLLDFIYAWDHSHKAETEKSMGEKLDKTIKIETNNNNTPNDAIEWGIHTEYFIATHNFMYILNNHNRSPF